MYMVFIYCLFVVYDACDIINHILYLYVGVYIYIYIHENEDKWQGETCFISNGEPSQVHG